MFPCEEVLNKKRKETKLVINEKEVDATKQQKFRENI